jgi:molybdopterin converting factor small subunit
VRETQVEASLHPDMGSIFDHFARSHPLLEPRRHSVLFALNSEFARPDAPVRDGDEVAFFLPMSGG